MTNKELQAALRDFPDDLSVEVARVVAADLENDGLEQVRLDFPIIGLAESPDGDLVFVIGSAGARAFLSALGKVTMLGKE